jgi:hypothetical protein
MVAKIIGNIKFEAVRASSGWCVVIIPPAAGRIEFHDFRTEAGAKAWIKANARNWVIEYIKRASEWPTISNPKT